MPAQKRSKPLYQRGPYALHRRGDRANLEIVWYDAARKRERSASAGTGDVGKGRIELDRLYLESTGSRLCPTCHRPWEHSGSPLLASAIADYLIQSEGKAGIKSAKGRLAHVTDHLVATDPSVTCAAIDDRWVDGFRAWLLAKPVTSPSGTILRPRSLSHVEGCILQLAAAINATPGQTAQFKPEQAKSVARSPVYRADIETLARMFDFCLRPVARTRKERAYLVGVRRNLLRYLRLAVATWARPDAIFDAGPRQWNPDARVLDMNVPGRRQTKKHRPRVPIARQMVEHLNAGDAFLTVTTVRASWVAMRKAIGLPAGPETGEKLIRRSIATLGRKRIGEANWRQGEMMLGHVKTGISDVYALPDPLNLGRALAATESIIDDIERLAPGAFYRSFTANALMDGATDGAENG